MLKYYNIALQNDTKKELEKIKELGRIVYKSEITNYVVIEIDDLYFQQLKESENVYAIFEVNNTENLK